MNARSADILLVILVCLIWAGNYFVVKDVLPYSDPITFAFLRAFFGGLFVATLGGYHFRGLTLRDFCWLLAIGLTNVTLFLTLLNTSPLTAPPGVDSTLVHTQPMLVVGMTPLTGERLSARRVVGIVVAFGGVVLVFLPSFLGSSVVVGDLLAVGASFAWALAVVLFKIWKTPLGTRTVTSVQLLLGSALILLILPFQAPRLDPGLVLWLALGYNVVLATGVGFLIYWSILGRMSTSLFSSFFFQVPIFATIMGQYSRQAFLPPTKSLERSSSLWESLSLTASVQYRVGR